MYVSFFYNQLWECAICRGALRWSLCFFLCGYLYVQSDVCAHVYESLFMYLLLEASCPRSCSSHCM